MFTQHTSVVAWSGAAARIYNWGDKIYYTLPEAVHRGV